MAETGTTWSVTGQGQLEALLKPFGTIRHHGDYGPSLRVSEVELRRGQPGPVNYHERSTEFAYLAAGEAYCFVDGEIRFLTAHTAVFLPPGTSHGFKAVSRTATLLVVHTPFVPAGEDHVPVRDDFDIPNDQGR